MSHAPHDSRYDKYLARLDRWRPHFTADQIRAVQVVLFVTLPEEWSDEERDALFKRGQELAQKHEWDSDDAR